MDIGRFRTRLTIEAPNDAPDEEGGFFRTFVPVATVWAQIETLGGSEAVIEARLAQRLTHRVTLRWRAGLTGAHRFRLGERLFDILALRDPVGNRACLECSCTEVTP